MAEEEHWGELIPGSPGGEAPTRWADHAEEHSPTLAALSAEVVRIRGQSAKQKNLEDFQLDAGGPYVLDISGLPGGVTEDALAWFFSDKKIDVTRVEIQRTKQGQSTGMASIEVGDEWSYRTALGCSGSSFKQRTLKVSAASKNKVQQFTAPRGRGGSSAGGGSSSGYGNGYWEAPSKGKGRGGKATSAWDGGGKGGKGRPTYEPPSRAEPKGKKSEKGKGAKEKEEPKGKGKKVEEPKKKEIKKEEPKPPKKEEGNGGKGAEPAKPAPVSGADKLLSQKNGSAPAERPKLTLLPRSRPMDAPPPDSMRLKSDIFGGAKPRDETLFTKDVIPANPATPPTQEVGGLYRPSEPKDDKLDSPRESRPNASPAASPTSNSSWGRSTSGGKRGGKGGKPAKKEEQFVWRVAGSDPSADAKDDGDVPSPSSRGRGRGGKKRR